MTAVGDKIILTKSELKDIIDNAVNNAVENVVKKIQGIDIIDDKPEKINTTDTMDAFSKEQYENAMEVMRQNRGNGDEPKVGIFWYNVSKNELFGVVSHKRSDYTRANAGGGLITCSEMHEDVWKKQFNKQKYHGGEGPYIGAYQDKPRGRVFYSPAEDKYIIAVGKWFNLHEEVYDLIMLEFDLPEDKTIVKYGEHWDIGQTWM